VTSAWAWQGKEGSWEGGVYNYLMLEWLRASGQKQQVASSPLTVLNSCLAVCIQWSAWFSLYIRVDMEDLITVW